MKQKRLNPRKLLVASVGVATVNYAFAAGCRDEPGARESLIANLMPGPPIVAGFEGAAGPTVANLIVPPPPVTGSGGRDTGPFAPEPLPELPDAAADVPDAVDSGAADSGAADSDGG